MSDNHEILIILSLLYLNLILKISTLILQKKCGNVAVLMFNGFTMFPFLPKAQYSGVIYCICCGSAVDA